MDLWTEFEGVTIDRAFALNKLLQSEGRSAFFSTLNENGESVLIRIVECHFDEDEILARWRGVQTLGHPGFLRIDRFGQFLIEADDITAVYAVFERVDANLGQVLEKGRLSVADATQIGLSIASALETLHAHGFVHEHIESRNVFAVGESVKLRSDCIRETPEGEGGFAARRRDVHDLAMLLMHVLHGMPWPSYTPRHATLPAPFEDIVRNGTSGAWGLAEIKDALAPPRPPKAEPAAKAMPAASAIPPATATPTAATVPQAGQPASPAATPTPGGVSAKAWSRENAAWPQPRHERMNERPLSAVAEAAARTVFPRHERPLFEPSSWFTRLQEPSRRWIGAAVLFLFVVLFGGIVTHHFLTRRAAAAARPSSTERTAAAPAPAHPPLPIASSSQPASAPGQAAHAQAGWRVVAFTYKRKDQAQKRAAWLAQKHPALQPAVFSPNGRSPWLVTIGGALQRDAAYALAHRARSLGLPRDTYAQNYTR